VGTAPPAVIMPPIPSRPALDDVPCWGFGDPVPRTLGQGRGPGWNGTVLLEQACHILNKHLICAE